METPTATLGIRGTVFDVYRAQWLMAATVVILRNGQVVVNGYGWRHGTVLTQPGLASCGACEPGSEPGQANRLNQENRHKMCWIICAASWVSMPDDNVTWESTW
jgi:hypothetical protein